MLSSLNTVSFAITENIILLCKITQLKPQGLWENGIEAHHSKTSLVTQNKRQEANKNGSSGFFLHMRNDKDLYK